MTKAFVILVSMIQIRDAVDEVLHEQWNRTGGPAEFGQPLSDDEWDLLEARGLVRRIEAGTLTVQQMRDVVLENRRVYVRPRRGSRAPGSPMRPIPLRSHVRARQRALAHLFVADVETDARDRFGVQAFRREVLRDDVVRDVNVWMSHQVRRQGRPTVIRGRASLLAIRIDGDIVHRATRRKAILERLRQISESLAAFYGWEPADATTYVLTGTAPRVPAIKGDVRLKFPLPARSKIVLTIDPTATPREVAAAYASLRRRQFGRIRRLQPKHAELAVFAIRQHSQTEREQMEEWNRMHPGERYRFPSVFKRDSVLAIQALAELRPHRARVRS
jgi:hypothetical protein